MKKLSTINDTWLLTACGIGGVVLVLCAFLPWVTYRFNAEGLPQAEAAALPISWNAHGFDVEAVAGFGDGYVVATAGAVIAAISGIALLGPDRPWNAVLSLLVSGGLAFGIAAYDLSRKFTEPISRAGPSGNFSGFAHGDATAVLPTIVCIALAVATLGALLLLRQRNELSMAASTDASA